ncbi:MAG: hypothetical protein JSV84_04100 [Gemmatimonadota bacterium]|nr:MAG: hypothetical protein JSV84_04100 [Gemmatimonadota bacterium]
MKRVMIFLLIFVLCSTAIFGQEFDRDYLLQKRKVREQRRETRNQILQRALSEQGRLVPAQEDYDVRFYELDLNIDPTTESITGTVTIRAESVTDNLTQVVVNLSNTMTVTGVSGDGSGFTHVDELLTIDLNRSYNQDETFHISIAYTGNPVEAYRGLGFHFDTYGGEPAISNDSYPYFARSWWPCKDDPADKADSISMIITVPDGLTVVCNGSLRSVTNNPDNTTTYFWHEGYPISTYLVALAAANYSTFSDIYYPQDGDPLEILYYVFPQDLNAAMEDFNINVEAMEYFVSIYGEYPFLGEKYGITTYLSPFGAMEYQTITFYTPGLITGTHDNDDVVVHELAHMWWGDAVTNADWHSTWLNEGFAVYSEALWFGYLGGMDVYHDYMDITVNALGYTEPLYRYDTSDPWGVVAGVVYDKGAWILHMLRYVVGDDTFFQILLEYRAQYEFGNVTTEDLQAVCEQVSGQDLNWFFQEWIYESWHPEYYWGWHIENVVGNEYAVKGFIDQIQEIGPIFTMPLDIGIVTAGGDTLYETVYSDEQSEIFQLTVNEEPVELLLDPFNWVLKEAQGVFTPLVNYASSTVRDDGDNDGRADPGEALQLTLEIFNAGVFAYDLSAELDTDDPDVTITSGATDYGDVPHNNTVGNDQTPFLLSVQSSAETHLIKFYISFTASNGYTGLDSFYLTVGSPSLLLVDDDGGEQYERIYQAYLASDAVPFQVWGADKEGTPGDTLDDFEVVMWCTGRTRENTLTAADQTALSAYLDNGGRLFLSGQDIGYDLVALSNGVDFYTNYLRAEFVEDVSPEGFLQGVTGDPITGALGLLLVSQTVNSPDVIAPSVGANVALQYSPSRAAAGLKYGGDYRLVYFAVGLEGFQAITGDIEPVRETVLSNIVQWLQHDPQKGDVNEDGAINILDVVWAINIILGSIDPGPSQQWSADFDDNGSVNVLDAIKIVNEILGPAGMKMLPNLDRERTTICVEIETDKPLAGAQLNIAFDPEQCTPTAPLVKRGALEAAASMNENEMTVLLYSLEGRPVPEGGTLVEIPLTVLDNQPGGPNIWLQESTLAGVDGQEISGRVTVIRPKAAFELPTGFELFQNVPNPFNPETEIRFGIPAGYDDGLSVVLTIYNVLGQKVRTLVHGKFEAGYYTVRWDGLNHQGHPVASGLYFYLLETPDFRTMKRMVLMK